MRSLLVLGAAVAAAALTGCVGYGGGVYGADVHYGSSYGYGYSQPYVYGGTYYYDNRTSRRDRDGDGVPNWRDTRPDNPRRY